MATLKLVSTREQCGKGATYVLGAKLLTDAIEPTLHADMSLELNFTAKQADWKAHRDQIDELGTYQLLRLHYGIPSLEGKVRAIPSQVLPPGVSLKPLITDLLKRSLSELAPAGLPAVSGDRKYAWYLDLEYVAPERLLRALLSTGGNTGQWTLWKRLEVSVPPAPS